MAERPVRSTREGVASAHGAILIQVAIAMIVLIAFTGFVADHGLLWVGRRQAQNAADAGALAGAIAMAFDNDDRSATGPAKTSAYTFAISNSVAGEAPDVIDPATGDATDVKFYSEAPAAFPSECSDDSCIRVDVYRNQERSTPLPVWFSQLVGVTDQGVRATAIARAAVANASDCLKPFAIPDKWLDRYDVNPVIDVDTWTADDNFEEHADKQGTQPLADPDQYAKPTEASPGTGFTLQEDLGLMVELKAGGPQDAIAPGNYYPVRLPMPNGSFANGGDDYRWSIANCNGVPMEIGDTLQNEPGNMVGPTKQGLEDLIALDPNATWDPTEKQVANSCAQGTPSCGPRSPRTVAIPVFDTRAFYDGKINGLVTLQIVNILGFFVDQMQGNTVRGYLTTIPGLTVGSGTITPQAAFMYSVTLVR
jgi:Flp pilus assembly protein TadG